MSFQQKMLMPLDKPVITGHASILHMLVQGDNPLDPNMVEWWTVLQRLKEKGVLIPWNTTKNKRGQTPLGMALEQENWDVIEKILMLGGSPFIQNIVDGKSKTVLDVCLQKFSREQEKQEYMLNKLLYACSGLEIQRNATTGVSDFLGSFYANFLSGDEFIGYFYSYNHDVMNVFNPPDKIGGWRKKLLENKVSPFLKLNNLNGLNESWMSCVIKSNDSLSLEAMRKDYREELTEQLFKKDAGIDYYIQWWMDRCTKMERYNVPIDFRPLWGSFLPDAVVNQEDFQFLTTNGDFKVPFSVCPGSNVRTPLEYKIKPREQWGLLLGVLKYDAPRYKNYVLELFTAVMNHPAYFRVTSDINETLALNEMLKMYSFQEMNDALKGSNQSDSGITNILLNNNSFIAISYLLLHEVVDFNEEVSYINDDLEKVCMTIKDWWQNVSIMEYNENAVVIKGLVGKKKHQIDSSRESDFLLNGSTIIEARKKSRL